MSPNPQSLIPNPEIDATVRRVDEDRWLASRFASASVREKLNALYAVYYEIARTPEVAREPAIGLIRLAWWREALAEIAEGKPARTHPALSALRQSWGVTIDADAFAAITEARARDCEDAPFASEAELELYVDATAGVLMRVAMEACAPGVADNEPAFMRSAARAWGYAGLARTGRRAPVDLAALAQAAYAQAKPLSRALPSAAFPAMGYVALTPAFLRALHAERGQPALLSRQLKLVAAAATGCI